jgi:hypothetical protein
VSSSESKGWKLAAGKFAPDSRACESCETSLHEVYRGEFQKFLDRFDRLPSYARRKVIAGMVFVGLLCLAVAVLAFGIRVPGALNAAASGPRVDIAGASPSQPGAFETPPGDGSNTSLELASGAVGVDGQNSGLYILSPAVQGVRTIVLGIDKQFDALVGSLRALGDVTCKLRLPDGVVVAAKPGLEVPIVALRPEDGLIPLAAISTGNPDRCLIGNPGLRRARLPRMDATPTPIGSSARSPSAKNAQTVEAPRSAEPDPDRYGGNGDCRSVIDLQLLAILPCRD